jgi:NAD(P)-dependent dehydrogenase (short-subunit alcohol dehydrogenase family)
MRLKGKVAIVTGAGQRPGEGVGNGPATAMIFAREGARVLLANRSIASVEETRDLIRAEGYEAECMVADVCIESDCEKLVQAAMAKYGRLDIVQNNAGIALPDGDTLQVRREDWDETIKVNLTGAMQISKHALPPMRRQNSGCIIHVSSIAAIGSIPVISYKVAKSALNEFTRWLAFENAPHNIRCNVLLLGLMDTPMGIEYHHKASGTPRDELRRQRSANVPMKRMGTPWETAAAALFLASDDASYITGAVLPLDGGMHTRVGA